MQVRFQTTWGEYSGIDEIDQDVSLTDRGAEFVATGRLVSLVALQLDVSNGVVPIPVSVEGRPGTGWVIAFGGTGIEGARQAVISFVDPE